MGASGTIRILAVGAEGGRLVSALAKGALKEARCAVVTFYPIKPEDAVLHIRYLKRIGWWMARQSADKRTDRHFADVLRKFLEKGDTAVIICAMKDAAAVRALYEILAAARTLAMKKCIVMDTGLSVYYFKNLKRDFVENVIRIGFAEHAASGMTIKEFMLKRDKCIMGIVADMAGYAARKGAAALTPRKIRALAKKNLKACG